MKHSPSLPLFSLSFSFFLPPSLPKEEGGGGRDGNLHFF